MRTMAAAALLALSGAIVSAAAAPKATPAHVMVAPDALKWGPLPAVVPGATLAVVSGDPSKSGAPFVLRIKTPDGYRIPAHWHPTDENLTVLQGTLLLGIGEKEDPAAMHELTTGTYARMPKGVRHFGVSKGETIVQVHGVGPFKIMYVNPADDPARKH